MKLITFMMITGTFVMFQNFIRAYTLYMYLDSINMFDHEFLLKHLINLFLPYSQYIYGVKQIKTPVE